MEKQKAPALGKGTDGTILYALVITECRMLYGNAPLVSWVEKQFGHIFLKAHTDLRKTTNIGRVQEAIDDVISLVKVTNKDKPVAPLIPQ